MKDYLTTVKDRVIIIKEEKGKVIAVTAAVCALLGIIAVLATKVCRTCDKLAVRGKEGSDNDSISFDDKEAAE